MLVWCNGSRDPELGPSNYLNTGYSLGGTHGALYLFNASEQIVDSLRYGFQVPDLSIGRNNSGEWTLLSFPPTRTRQQNPFDPGHPEQPGHQ
ncbi:MAG: hypothetical protein Ct9H300mP7_3900 [Verrucomicrobiota bacterium]|nr:MAG: hypothetical protein Ct9H300mP7_3900 [Verrucomicrobiota bacterium]